MHKSNIIVLLSAMLLLNILLTIFITINLNRKITTKNQSVVELSDQLDQYNLQIINNKNLTDVKFKKLQLLLQDYLVQQNRPESLAIDTSASWQQMLIPDILPIKDAYEVSQSFENEHFANDLSMALGTKVYATASGVVVDVANEKYFGNLVRIDHLNGYQTLFAHLQRILVKEKTFVKKGELIALSGDTGYSLSPHLHYEVSLNGIALDPQKMIKTGEFEYE